MSDLDVAKRRYWWVNQNQTHRDEISGGFMWSPKKKSDGARNQFYDNMRLVQRGDVVLAYFGTKLQAVGVVESPAVSEPKPAFQSGGAAWSEDGWFVAVEFESLPNPVRPKDFIDLIGPHLPAKYSPLRDSGDGLQSVYLAELPAALARLLLELTAAELKEPPAIPLAASAVDDVAELGSQPSISATERERLVKARLGQGAFRSRIRLREPACRVTGVSQIRHLRASHIKPWSKSSNAERLDGANGLLLAPHADHLFDQGWISFGDEGTLLVSPALDRSVLRSWSIGNVSPRPFDDEQAGYLRFHREQILRR